MIQSIRKMSFIDCDIGDSFLIPNTPSLFQLGDSSTTEGNLASSIPICSVCLDGVGDMVLKHCNHGGICEDCARHIALNKAVGGSHCPKCRQEIVYILRIGELQDEFVKVRQIALPELPRDHPPRVPPPPGSHKAKSGDDSTEPSGRDDSRSMPE